MSFLITDLYRFSDLVRSSPRIPLFMMLTLRLNVDFIPTHFPDVMTERIMLAEPIRF